MRTADLNLLLSLAATTGVSTAPPDPLAATVPVLSIPDQLATLAVPASAADYFAIR